MPDFDFSAYYSEQTNEHKKVAEETFPILLPVVRDIVESAKASIENGGKILFCGNGGSAADAQHLAAELSIRFIKDRQPIHGLALTTDTSVLTAGGNDLGFDHIFSRQVDAFGREGDVLIGLSTSGNSQNILNALETAQQKSMITVGFTGRDGGKMKELCDHCLIISSQTTARIQEMHITFGHIFCGALEHSLGLV